MNNLSKEEQLEILARKYVELVEEVATELYHDEGLTEGIDPFDYLMETNPSKVYELMNAFRILQSIAEEGED